MSKQIESYVKEHLRKEYDEAYEEFEWSITLPSGKELIGKYSEDGLECFNDTEELDDTAFYIIEEVEDCFLEYLDESGDF